MEVRSLELRVLHKLTIHPTLKSFANNRMQKNSSPMRLFCLTVEQGVFAILYNLRGGRRLLA